ncbi:hypothetical protein BH18ACT15_BH18ACT15_04730 [soil metagenome]
MTSPDEQGHPEPPLAGDETATLLGSLERQRATLAWKCGGLDAAGLRATVAPSSITLGGLLKHLAFVEAVYFSWRLHGRDPGPPWNTVDWVWGAKNRSPCSCCTLILVDQTTETVPASNATERSGLIDSWTGGIRDGEIQAAMRPRSVVGA